MCTVKHGVEWKQQQRVQSINQSISIFPLNHLQYNCDRSHLARLRISLFKLFSPLEKKKIVAWFS